MKKRIAGKVIIAMLLAVAVFFAGCTQEQVIEVVLENTLEFAVNSAVAENEDAAKVVAHMQKRIDMKVLSSEIKDTGAMAECRVASPDLTEFVENFNANDYATQEELVDAICKAIDTAPIVTHEMTLGFEVTEDGYNLIDVEVFLNAYCGGCLDILQNMQGGVNNNGNTNGNGNKPTEAPYDPVEPEEPPVDPTEPKEPPTEPVEPPVVEEDLGKVVIKYVAEGKYVTGTPAKYPYKLGLCLDENKTNALAYSVIKNEDGTVSFRTDCGRFLAYADNDLVFTTEKNDSTKFILIANEDGYYIQCAFAYYGVRPQYLEVWENSLTYYSMDNSKNIEYMFVFTLEDAAGAVGAVVEHYEAPIFETDMERAVIKYVAEEKYVTGTEYLQTSSSNTKTKLMLSENKANALAYSIIRNADGTISFKTDCGKYLFCDGNSVQFAAEESDYTKFVLETAKDGCYIRCATATNGDDKVDYLEVYGGTLTAHNIVTNRNLFIFVLEDATGAAGTVVKK